MGGEQVVGVGERPAVLAEGEQEAAQEAAAAQAVDDPLASFGKAQETAAGGINLGFDLPAPASSSPPSSSIFINTVIAIVIITCIIITIVTIIIVIIVVIIITNHHYHLAYRHHQLVCMCVVHVCAPANA